MSWQELSISGTSSMVGLQHSPGRGEGTPLMAEARAAVWQGKAGDLSPSPQELLVRKGYFRVMVRCVPHISPSHGLVKFSLGWLPGAAPPASAAKG